MIEQRVDCLVVDQLEHIVYFGGHLPTAAMYQALLVSLSGETVAVIRALDAPVFSETSRLVDCVAIDDSENPVKVVSDTIKARGYGSSRVGVERDAIS